MLTDLSKAPFPFFFGGKRDAAPAVWQALGDVPHYVEPFYRIVLAGFEGEHDELQAAGWRVVEWFRTGFLKGGMGQQSAAGHQQHRERLWLSPHCLGEIAEPDLFSGLEES